MQDLLKDDDKAEKFDGVLNGIRIAPVLPNRPSVCGEGSKASYVETDRVEGTPVEISPAYLPRGTERVTDTVRGCPDGTISEHVIGFEVPTDAGLGRFGGPLQIVRGLGEHRFAHEAAASSARETEVAGRPAALFEPLSADGFGQSAVFIAEPWGMTAVQAYGLTVDELVKIAEGLYAEGDAR